MDATIPCSAPVIINLQETQQQQQQQVLVVKQHLQIEYAVFFNHKTTSNHHFQSLQKKGIPNPPSHVDPLVPLPKRQKRSMISGGGGTWLSSSSSSSSTASLFLFSYTSQSPLVLLISLAGRIHEEHFISKLHFSWPQMSCVSQSPPKGSRVVLASYKDSVGDIQKFAMRFLNSSQSQSFLETLKESLKDVETVGAPISNVLSGIQPENERIQLDEVHHGVAVELNLNCPATNGNPLVQPSVRHGVEVAVFGGTSPADNRSTDGNIPSSFTALLNNSSNDAPEDATVPLKFPREVDLFSHLAKNLSESTFHVMLGKLEKFIKDKGGDLALQSS